jgi:pimeloyl-ACP methyl ester carboxylesterase
VSEALRERATGVRDDDPATLVAEMRARARRVETRCPSGTVVWHIWGEGRPVVLAHGSSGNWTHWIRNIDALAPHYRVIAADLPGQGDSGMPITADHRGIAAALGEGLGELLGEGGRADLVGFSLGGVLFAYLAAWYPALVNRLVLVGTGGLDTPKGEVRIGRVGGLRGEERVAAIKANLLGLMLHHPESTDELAQYLLLANAAKSRLDPKGLVSPDRLIPILPQITAQLDAIWGEFDRPHPDPALQADVIRRSHPDCDFRVVADAGHWAMYERAEAFNAALLDLLAQPLRAGRG